MTTLSFTLPDQSFLFHTLQRCHYIDRFQEVLTDRKDSIKLAQAVATFFTASPGWVRPLVGLRNQIAGLLGLKRFVTVKKEKLSNTGCRLQALPLQLFHQTDNEIVLGDDDRHLSFRISFYLERQNIPPFQKVVMVTTMVQFHNLLGKLYFFPVRAFHRRLVPALLKSMAGELEQQNFQPQ